MQSFVWDTLSKSSFQFVGIFKKKKPEIEDSFSLGELMVLLWGNSGSNDFLRGVKDRENHWQIDGFEKQDSEAAPSRLTATKLLPNQYTGWYQAEIYW